FTFEAIHKVEHNEEKISSTKIRNLLAEGKIKEASNLLGRPFSFEGKVVDGDKRDRKSTRLNSSHVSISYAVFCLKKKKTIKYRDNLLGSNFCIPKTEIIFSFDLSDSYRQRRKDSGRSKK